MKTKKQVTNNKIFVEPMQEIEPLANVMILQKSIKINLTSTLAHDRRRIIDFLCGISYVIGFVVDKTDHYVYEFKIEN